MVLFISMSRRKLPNYLRTRRKRAGLWQEEVAFLLGCSSDTEVSRFERNVRLPTLKIALAYEVIFGIPVRELFGGVFEEIEREVLKRAEILTQKLQEAKSDVLTARKLEFLRLITSGPDIISDNS